MKILQIINSHALSDGGAQRLALELHRAYGEAGHEAHLLSLMHSPTDERNTYSLGFANPYDRRVGPRLRRFLRARRWHDLDVIHVHLFPAQAWVALLRREVRAPLVTTEHNTFNRRRASFAGRVLDRWTLRAYGAIICVSDATRDALSTWQPQTRERLVTIRNGIDLSRFEAPRQGERAGVPVALAVGRLSAQKNYAAALCALALLPEGELRLQIAGQDEMNGQMQALSRELGIAERVEFLGYQRDVPALLRGADLFLMTSHWEGLSLAVVEAMAAGLPVVVPDVPGMREVVQGADDAPGFLIDPDAPSDIAARLQTLARDAALRQQMGQRAREHAARFDLRDTITAHLKLYGEMAWQKRGTRP